MTTRSTPTPALLAARHTTPDGRRFAVACVRLSYHSEGDCLIEEIKVNAQGNEYSEPLATLWRIGHGDECSVFSVEDWERKGQLSVPASVRVVLLNALYEQAVDQNWGCDACQVAA